MKQLSPDADAARRLVKITRERIEAALDELEKSALDDETIHSARKSLKKARAGLRMLRPGLKQAEYRKANAALRDASGPLSAVRDAKVLVDTRAELMTNGSGERLRADGLKRLLEQHRRQTRQQIVHDRQVLARARHLLRATRARMGKWKASTSDWDLVGASLNRLYRKARVARDDAWTKGTAEALHEWRKQVKYLRYALEMLEPLWPALVGALAREARELSDKLGDSHDLTVLSEMTVAHPDALDSTRTLDAVLTRIECRQRTLIREARILGARMFDDKPAAFVSRFEHYWRDWCQAADAA